MKFKNIFAMISPILEHTVEYSAATFLFFNMIFHFSIMSMFLFIGSLVYIIFIYIFLQLLHDLRSSIEMNTFLEEYKHYNFQAIDFDTFLGEKHILELKGMLRIYRKNLVNCYLSTIVDKSVRKRFYGFRAFPSMLLTGTIILPSLSTNMNVEEKFKLFHELGHLSKGHYKVLSYQKIYYISCLYLLFISSIIINGNPYIILALFIVTSFFLININQLSNYSLNKIESVADIFALSMIRDEEGFNKIVKYLKGKKIIDNDITNYCNWWIEEYVDTTEMKKPFMHLGGKQFKEMLQYTLTDKAVNYYSLVEKLSTPPIYAVLIMIITIVCSAFFTSKNITNSGFIILLITLIGIPIILLLWIFLSIKIITFKNRILLSKNSDI